MDSLENVRNEIDIQTILFEQLNIYFFQYDIPKRTVYVPEKTRHAFSCKEVYKNMPYSFADDFVADEYHGKFFRFYKECHSGKENCECAFEDKDHVFFLCVKLQISKRDKDGNPLLAIGIIEHQGMVKGLVERQKKCIEAILANSVGYLEVNLTKNEIIGEIVDARTRLYSEKTSTGVKTYRNLNYNEFEIWWSENMLISDKKEFLRVSNADYMISCYNKGKYVVDVFCSSKTMNGNITENKQTYYLSKDDATGDIIAMCVVHDLTEQRKKERDSQRKNLVIQKLCDEYDCISYVRVADGFIIDYQVDNIFASWKDERKGQFLYPERVERFADDIVFADDKEKFKKGLHPETIKERLQEKSFYNLDYRVEENGIIHYFNAKVVRDDTNEQDFCVIIGLRNVDEEVRQHRVLEEALRYAEHASKAKTKFLSNMSHDMRTPMNAIIGYTALAATHIDDKEKTQNYLKKIAASSNHLLSLINDILDMNRIESGKVVLHESEENLAEIMHDIRTMMQSQVTSKQIDFYIDTCDVRDELIYCDGLRLKQIILNIFSNAIKYTSSGGTISVRIIQKEQQQRDYGNYEFHIKDSGKGMSKEFLEHIFEPFAREEQQTSEANPGTGLGLSIVKNIVDMMNGKIEVKSEVEKGSEFIISLTFKIQKEGHFEYDFSQIEGFRALVVDDDFHTCDTVMKMLRDIGMRPEFSLHGKEAVLRAKQAYDIKDEFFMYIIDWMMPDMNGIEVARRIRKEIGDDVPIIILTAYDWECIREEAKEVGITAICEKPLFMSNLKKIIAASCGWEKIQIKEETVCMDFYGKKVLLAEDIEINQEIANEILSDKGFEVTIAENGKIALEILKQAKPGEYDIILMDIRMPEMNGYEATKAIRQMDSEYRNIPIVAMTANAFEDDRQMAFSVGMNEHVPKPLDEEYLFTILYKFLN